jgi:hypothetical protein
MRDFNNHGRLYSFLPLRRKKSAIATSHLSYLDLWPYLGGEESENLIIVKLQCSLRCVSSCGRNPEILHPPFLMRNLNPLIKKSVIAKIRQKDLWSYLYQDGLENLMIVKPVRVLSSVFLCVKLGIHLSWWEISIQLTIYDARITVCPELREQDCLNNQEKCSFLFGKREHCVIAIILKSHFIFLLGSVITQYTTAQPNREETAAIVSLSFSS